jgi:bifunctional non-homologous end joining protein LigD
MLYYRGRCLTGLPFEERLHLLHTRLTELPCLALCEGVIGEGRAAFRAAISAGHEGVLAKRLSSRYLPNQRGWKKIKETFDLPCVVIGYRTGRDGLRDLVMATLVNGVLGYAGVVELGIYGKAPLRGQLQAMRRHRPCVRCSLSAHWVKPELFCTVRFAGRRPGGVWRDAVLVGETCGAAGCIRCNETKGNMTKEEFKSFKANRALFSDAGHPEHPRPAPGRHGQVNN